MSDLKTVGDYKEVGLEFVKGDSIIHRGNIYDNSLLTVSIHDGCNDDIEVHEFAWRANTGNRPDFNGEVEVQYRNGCVEIGFCDKFKWWLEIHLDPRRNLIYSDDVTLWRPHIPKSNTETPEEREAFERIENKSTYDVDAHVSGEHKPVFTQEMADRGEMPPVGAECMIIYHGDTSPAYDRCTVMYENSGVGVVNINGEVSCFDSTLHSVNLSEFKPIKTDREKAIDEITGEWPKACEHTIKLMHDLGYRKVES